MMISDETLKCREDRKKKLRQLEKEKNKIFGQNLQKAMKSLKVNMTDVQKVTFLDTRTLYDYMNGTRSPKAYNVLLLAKTLKVNFLDLYPL